jgi:EF hand
MKQMALAMLAALGMSMLTACDQEPESSATTPIEAQMSFERADGNNDGVVSPNEASSIANLDFAAADTDKNGALSPEELDVALVQSAPPR